MRQKFDLEGGAGETVLSMSPIVLLGFSTSHFKGEKHSQLAIVRVHN